MDEFEVESAFPNLRNFEVPVPGAPVMCYLGVFSRKPAEWHYSLWVNGGDLLIAVDTLDFAGMDNITAQQVARVAYLLSVDYATA